MSIAKTAIRLILFFFDCFMFQSSFYDNIHAVILICTAISDDLCHDFIRQADDTMSLHSDIALFNTQLIGTIRFLHICLSILYDKTVLFSDTDNIHRLILIERVTSIELSVNPYLNIGAALTVHQNRRQYHSADQHETDQKKQIRAYPPFIRSFIHFITAVPDRFIQDNKAPQKRSLTVRGYFIF